MEEAVNNLLTPVWTGSQFVTDCGGKIICPMPLDSEQLSFRHGGLLQDLHKQIPPGEPFDALRGNQRNF